MHHMERVDQPIEDRKSAKLESEVFDDALRLQFGEIHHRDEKHGIARWII